MRWTRRHRRRLRWFSAVALSGAASAAAACSTFGAEDTPSPGSPLEAGSEVDAAGASQGDDAGGVSDGGADVRGCISGDPGTFEGAYPKGFVFRGAGSIELRSGPGATSPGWAHTSAEGGAGTDVEAYLERAYDGGVARARLAFALRAPYSEGYAELGCWLQFALPSGRTVALVTSRRKTGEMYVDDWTSDADGGASATGQLPVASADASASVWRRLSFDVSPAVGVVPAVVTIDDVPYTLEMDFPELPVSVRARCGVIFVAATTATVTSSVDLDDITLEVCPR
jgi:hypothetical protein